MSDITPGIHSLDDAVYHALPYASKHALDVIAERSPMHLRYQREHPTEATEAMRFGTAFHCAVLEPDRFTASHPIIGKCSAVKQNGGRCENDGKARVGDEWFCGVHLRGTAGKHADTVAGAITQEQADSIGRMADAIRRHKAAAAMLDSEGTNETAAVWDLTVEGDGWNHVTRCKLKADALRPAWAAVVDVKTTESASREEFERSIAKFSYHRQGAFYANGIAAAAGWRVDNFVFIVVEKTPPHAVAVYRLLDDAIMLGREQNEKLLRIYAACERSNHWWGYEQEFQDVSLPRWAFQRLMSEL